MPKKIKAGILVSGKHHCRRCGGVVCSDCSTRKCVLPELGFQEPVKVCDLCFQDEHARRDVHAEESRNMYIKVVSVAVADIGEIYRRRYLLRKCALEIFCKKSHQGYLFNFSGGRADAALFLQKLLGLAPPSLGPAWSGIKDFAGLAGWRLLRAAGWTEKWQRREISNFDYLMHLNTYSGRTFNDLTQYPVMPWTLKDYKSQRLNLNDPNSFRDLSKPIGALNASRLEMLLERYHDWDETEDIPAFLYGSHYSNIGSVLYFLLRLEPFTNLHIEMQGGSFDVPERLFHSIPDSWDGVMANGSDLKELIPEMYTLPEMFKNINKYRMGKRQDGIQLGHVELPPWAENSAEKFIAMHREALESDYVSQNLHHWIDLIFGYKQRGDAAKEANNIFFYLTYEDAIDIESLSGVERVAAETQIASFGQTPSQLFRNPHPTRNVPGITEKIGDILEEEGLRWVRLPPPLVASFLSKKSSHISSDIRCISYRLWRSINVLKSKGSVHLGGRSSCRLCPHHPSPRSGAVRCGRWRTQTLQD